MLASSWVDLNIDQDRTEETRNVENFEDGDFPALRSSYDGQEHPHQSLCTRKILMIIFSVISLQRLEIFPFKNWN